MTTASQDLRHRAEAAIAQQAAGTVTVLSSLLAVQDVLGYLPAEALEAVAVRTGHSANDVWGVASFYPNFRFAPPSRHTVELCWGLTCELLGAQTLLRDLLDRLGLDGEGDTPDGAVTLRLNTCLGACPHGPVVSFDHHLAGHITVDEAVRRVDQMRSDGHGPEGTR